MHLENTESQRAMIAAQVANLQVGRPSDNSADLPNITTSQSEAAKQLHVSTRLVTDAKAVLKSDDPGLIADVQSGKRSVTNAAIEARKLKLIERWGTEADKAALQAQEATVEQIYEAITERQRLEVWGRANAGQIQRLIAEAMGMSADYWLANLPTDATSQLEAAEQLNVSKRRP